MLKKIWADFPQWVAQPIDVDKFILKKMERTEIWRAATSLEGK